MQSLIQQLNVWQINENKIKQLQLENKRLRDENTELLEERKELRIALSGIYSKIQEKARTSQN